MDLESVKQKQLEKAKDIVFKYVNESLPNIKKEDTDRIFTYLKNYYLITDKDFKIYDLHKKMFKIKGYILTFFEKYGNNYKSMTPLEILDEILGKDIVDSAIDNYLLTTDGELSIPNNDVQEYSNMESVDGGRRKRRTKKRKLTRRRTIRKRKSYR